MEPVQQPEQKPICHHQFIHVRHVEKYKESGVRPDKYGVRVVCPLCGDTRDIWEDGSVEHIKHG